MNKYIILSLLLINDSLSFSTISNLNNFRLRKNIAVLRDRPSFSNIQRREVFRIARVITIPYVFGNFIDIANAAKKDDKNIEALREEANRIIEIIEVQKILLIFRQLQKLTKIYYGLALIRISRMMTLTKITLLLLRRLKTLARRKKLGIH